MKKRPSLKRSPYYGMALLKISHEMKDKNDPEFEQLFEDTLSQLDFDRMDFDRFMEETRERLLEIAKEIGL